MHYVLEVIMPPVKDVKEALDQVMDQFCEDGNANGWWDWWVIGGRWAGTKEMDGFDGGRLTEFKDELEKMKVTVSGIQCGKPTLEPKSQQAKVDKLWRKFFPEAKNKKCLLFSHSGDQYSSEEWSPGDVMELGKVSSESTASRVIIAGPDEYADKEGDQGKMRAQFMLSQDIWNGTNHEETTWGGNVLEAVEKYKDRLKGYKEDYREAKTPKDDWIVVTVDYHS